jgi:hypothetical protein
VPRKSLYVTILQMERTTERIAAEKRRARERTKRMSVCRAANQHSLLYSAPQAAIKGKGKREKRNGKCLEGEKEVEEGEGDAVADLRRKFRTLRNVSPHTPGFTHKFDLKPASPNFLQPSRRVTNTQVAMAATMSLSTSHNTTPPPQFTPLEQELLAEYQKLVTNMNTVLPPPLRFWGRVVDG